MKRIFLIAGLIFVLAGCSKYKSSDYNSGGGGQTNMNTVSMKNSVFSPATLQIGVNTTVIWVNDDNMVHTVTANDGSFNSGDIAPGGRFSYKFATVGGFDYHCIHHSNMVGTVVVAGIK